MLYKKNVNYLFGGLKKLKNYVVKSSYGVFISLKNTKYYKNTYFDLNARKTMIKLFLNMLKDNLYFYNIFIMYL